MARWEEVERLYHAALERDAGERAAFLRDACAGDEALRHEVESLLAQASAASGFLNGPAVDAAARLMTEGKSRTGLGIGDSGVGLTGRRIGTYQILSRLGAGGMGEVYRARDTKLGRDVAIKVLPPMFTADRDRLARFEREARVLATLNHPHIGAIYGLEDADGIRALVLELVDGETLAELLGRTEQRERAESRGQRAEGREQRAESKGQRAKGREQRAESRKACRWPRRSPLLVRSPTRSMRRTRKASSIAI